MAEDWIEKFGEIVRKARLQLNMTQEEVGEAVGVDKRTIHNIEHGLSNPKLTVLYPLIRLLSIDPKLAFYPEHRQESPAYRQLQQMIEGCSEKEISTLLIVVKDILDARRSPNLKDL